MAADVHGLNEVLELAHLLLQLINRDLGILNNSHQLQLLDTVPDGDQLAGAPEKAVHLNGLAVLEHLVHVGLIVPRLDIEKNGGFGNEGWLLSLFVSISLQSLLGNPLLLVLTAEKINIIVVVIASRGSSTSGIVGSVLASLGELFHASTEWLDMVVPAQGVGCVRLGSSSQRLVHSSVSLAWDIPLNIAVLSWELIESFHTSGRLEISKHF